MGKPTKKSFIIHSRYQGSTNCGTKLFDNLILGQLKIEEHQAKFRALVDICLVNWKLRTLHEKPNIDIMSLIKEHLVLQNLSNYPVSLCAMI